MKNRTAPGTRLTSHSSGVAIAAVGKRGLFGHPFRPLFGANQIRLTKGLVFFDEGEIGSLEPLIGKVPISGDDDNPQPVLKLDPKDIKKETGESWVCVEVTPNAKGIVDEKSTVLITHRNSPRSSDPKVGRHPLCLVLWNEGNAKAVFPIAMFNLRYFRTTPAAGKGIPVHRFY